MTDVIGFLFTTLGDVWAVIVSNWILSFSALTVIIGYIVVLVKESREQ